MLPMSDLARVFAGLGCSDVTTYIQSGNVVFRPPSAGAQLIADGATVAIRKRMAMDIPVIVRSASDLDAVVRTNPFIAGGADVATLHVMFLQEEPAGRLVGALDANRSPPDAFVVRGREIYLCCPNGMARTKLSNAYFDSKLRTISTVRNWRTVLKLQAMTHPRADESAGCV